MMTLNTTHPLLDEAYYNMRQAARLGHTQARLHYAWAELLGSNPVNQDIESAKETFYELAENQNVADAHMVCNVILIELQHCFVIFYDNITITRLNFSGSWFPFCHWHIS